MPLDKQSFRKHNLFITDDITFNKFNISENVQFKKKKETRIYVIKLLLVIKLFQCNTVKNKGS